MSEQEQNKTGEQGQKSLPDAHSGKEKPSKPRSGNRISKVGVLGCLLGLTAIAGVGGLGWKGCQIWRQLPTEAQLMTRVNEALAPSRETHETILVLKAELNDTREQYSRLVSRMDNLNRKLVRLQGSDRSDWLLAEAEYLLRLANQRLLTMRDVKSAMTLLSQADQLLISVDEYGLFPVRQALAEDIAALKAVERFDLEGTWLKINALIGRIDKLPLLPPPSGFKPDQPESPNEEAIVSDETWQQRLETTALETWHAFTGQFRIRTNNHEAVTALLPPSEELYLRQNLRLMLEQAQLALLQGQENLYQTSLANAQSWLQTWFLNTGPEIAAVHSQLSALQQVQVLQKLPDISRSVVTLKGYVDDLAEQRLPVTPVPNKTPSDSNKPATANSSEASQ